MLNRSWLFAPGHQATLVQKVFEVGADAVILDLEDAVPASEKARARMLVADATAQRPAWVRVNEARTAACEADLDAVGDVATGIRIPKVESVEDVRWVAERSPGKPLICAIETGRGVQAAGDIAAAPGVTGLALGGLDLQRDLGVGDDPRALLYVRSHLVVASRAAGIDRPIDSVYPKLDDDAGLRAEANDARVLGFFGKSAVHPRQVAIINEVFTPTPKQISWARMVLEAFQAAGGDATRLSTGEFVDQPVARRAERLLELAAALEAR